MSKVYSAILKRITIRLKRSEKVGFPMIYQISIEFWIRNTLLQKFLQTDMIFFDQFKVTTMQSGKCFAEFMIPIALLKELAVKNLLLLLESLTCEDAMIKQIS